MRRTPWQSISTPNELPKDSRICIYGSGNFSEKIFDYIVNYREDIEIVFFVDSFNHGEKCGTKIINVENLMNCIDCFDLVIIASMFYEDILTTLKKYAISKAIYIIDINFDYYLMIEAIVEGRKVQYNSINIELTSYCNMQCEFCRHPVMKKELTHMSYSLFLSIIDCIQDNNLSDNILLAGLGEPLLHPDVFEILQYCGITKMCTTLYTNGLLLNQDLYKQIAKAKTDNLYISVIGMSVASYSLRNAKTKNYDTYIKDILSCVDISLKLKTKTNIILALMFETSDSQDNCFNIPNLFHSDTYRVFQKFISNTLRIGEKVWAKPAITGKDME